jgi:hypothetical protein
VKTLAPALDEFEKAMYAPRYEYLTHEGDKASLTSMGYSLVSGTHWTVRPVMVVVAAKRSTMTWWLVKGRPRQFMVICENSRVQARSKSSEHIHDRITTAPLILIMGALIGIVGS